MLKALEAFRSELGIDDGGEVLDPHFADITALDFRLDPGAAPIVRAAYPQGHVPEVKLGLESP